MGNAVIPRRKGGNYTTVKFENYEFKTLEKREVENLSEAKEYIVATSVGNYALIGGGWGKSITKKVDAYNVSLVRTMPADLTEAKIRLAAAKTGEYGLFAGGYSANVAHESSSVDAYSANLAHTTPTSLSEARENLAATMVGDYSLFAGGDLTGISVDAGGNSLLGTYSSDKVDVYDDNLAQTTATALSLDRTSLVAATAGEYAIFAGGYTYSTDDGSSKRARNVDAYSSSLVHSTLADVTYDYYDTATSVGNYALFATGYYAQASNASVDVYNISLVKLTPVNLSDKKDLSSATAIANFALFGGGQSNAEIFSKVEGFDKNLVLHQFEDLSETRCSLAATTVGNYAFFAGGFNGYSGENSATVDCYEYVEKNLELTLYKGTRYKFQDMDAEVTVEADMETKTIATPATGYIKLKKVTLS